MGINYYLKPMFDEDGRIHLGKVCNLGEGTPETPPQTFIGRVHTVIDEYGDEYTLKEFQELIRDYGLAEEYDGDFS